MNSKEIDVELLRAMMMGDFAPSDKDDLENKAISRDLHRKPTSNKLNQEASTFQDQLAQFEKLIDQALVNNIKQITIIHGKGAGILRKELHKRLRKNPVVKSYKLNENNEGETLVYLK